ncbi:hypothetical protein KW535_14320 [Vibrio fluvialis]|nr:hypothetical protein [Vibrio fluvialis]
MMPAYRIPHPRFIVILVLLCLTMLVSTYWSTRPSDKYFEVLTLPDNIETPLGKLPEQPSGNVFNLGRALRLGDKADTPSEEQPKKSNSDHFRLLGITKEGKMAKALFVGDSQIVTLETGAELPGYGYIENIEHNKVTIIDSEGSKQEWLLFPTGANNVKDVKEQ